MSAAKTSRGRAQGASESGKRGLLLTVAGVAVAGLLVAGAAYPGHGVLPVARSGVTTLLPEVGLTASTASVWNCPGPLPVTGGSTSSIAIANPGTRVADATVVVAETAVTADEPKAYPTGEPLKDQVIDLQIGPHSVRDVAIVAESVPVLAAPATSATSTTSSPGKATKRPATKPSSPATVVDASLSATVSGASVGVSETVTSPNGTLARACAVGSAADGYTASGVTAGSSDVHVALFDPSAAPAVVNVSVGTGSGIVQPQAYQGVTIAPMSLAVLDLAQYVPQEAHVALSVRAVVGRVVIGSLSTVAARFRTKFLGPSHSYQESGQQLAVGIGSPLAHWYLPLGPTGSGYSEAVRLFNPGSHTAVVMLRTSASDAKPVSLTVSVSPGETVTVAAPVVTARSPAAPTTSVATTTTTTSPTSTSSASQPAVSDGVVTVTSTNGVGVVAEHETYETTSPSKVSLVSSAPTAVAPSAWVVPAMVQSTTMGGSVSVTDAGTKAVSVRVYELPQLSTGQTAGSHSQLTPAPSQLTTVEVQPGTSVVVELHALMPAKSPASFGLELTATGPVLVTASLQPAKKGSQAAVASGVPAL